MQPIIISENDSEEDINLRPKKRNFTDNEKVFNNEERRIHLELEIEERKMSLKERDIALRKAAAEAEAIELANEKLKLSLR